MTNTALASIIHEEHLGRCSKHMDQSCLLFSPLLPLKILVRSAPERNRDGCWEGGEQSTHGAPPAPAPRPGFCTQTELWAGPWDLRFFLTGLTD